MSELFALYFLVFAFLFCVTVASKRFRAVAIAGMIAMVVLPAGFVMLVILYFASSSSTAGF